MGEGGRRVRRCQSLPERNMQGDNKASKARGGEKGPIVRAESDEGGEAGEKGVSVCPYTTLLTPGGSDSCTESQG